jgi:hypothetical protein
MKDLVRFVTAAALLLTLSAFSGKVKSSIEGKWVGEYTSIDRSVPFTVHFWEKNNELKGSIDLLDGSSKERPLSWIIVESSSVHFEFVQNSRTLVFDGQLKNGKISGDLLYSSLRGKFQLTSQNLVSL